MPDTPLVDSPAGFVPRQAVSFGGEDTAAVAVTRTTPLPTEAITAPATSTPLIGTSTAAQVAGPFVPDLGRNIVVALSGNWSGTVQLLRSTDGGATRLPLTPAGITMGQYGAPGVDTPWVETEAGAAFYLSLPGAGISYRVSQ